MGCDPPAESKFSLDLEGDWILEAVPWVVHTAAVDGLLPGGGALDLFFPLIFTCFLNCVCFSPPFYRWGVKLRTREVCLFSQPCLMLTLRAEHCAGLWATTMTHGLCPLDLTV